MQNKLNRASSPTTRRRDLTHPLVSEAFILSAFESIFNPGTVNCVWSKIHINNYVLLLAAVSYGVGNERQRGKNTQVMWKWLSVHQNGEKGVKELKRAGKERKNAGRRNSVQNSLNAVNSLKHVETRRLRQDSIPSQILRVLMKLTKRQRDALTEPVQILYWQIKRLISM